MSLNYAMNNRGASLTVCTSDQSQKIKSTHRLLVVLHRLDSSSLFWPFRPSSVTAIMRGWQVVLEFM